jgi:O-antigen/teichoic acid export membrane protein
VGLGKAFSTSVVNQAISSCTNFALGLYLVRCLTPVEFGLYGIGFAISLFYSVIGNALFLTQMVVRVPDKTVEDRLPYAARILVAVTLFCLMTALVASLVHLAGRIFFTWIARYECLILPITAASISYLLKDFFVRHSYTARKEIWALSINSAVAFTLSVLLLAQSYSGLKFSSEKALCFYSISNLMGAVSGFFLARLPIRAVRKQRVVEDVREAWQGGRWAIGGSSVIWLQSQAYTYVTAVVLGPAGVGYANAGQMLIRPFLMLAAAINQVTMPRIAELRSQGGQKVAQVGLLITTGLLVLAMCYVAMVLFFADYVTSFVLGSQFQNLRPIIIAWAFVLLLQLLRDGATGILEVMKHFRALMLTNIVSALVTVLAIIVLMKSFGVPGSIFGTGMGEFLLACMLWRIVWIERHEIC